MKDAMNEPMNVPLSEPMNMLMKIDTSRCLIRPFEESDIDDFMVYRNNMDWMRYQSFKGLTKQEYRESLLQEASIDAGIQLAVILKSTSTIIGDIYLKQEGDLFWIGYTISPTYARQGFAYEAVSAVIQALREKGAVRFKAGVEPENRSSIKMLEKLDFVFDSVDGDEQIYVLNLLNPCQGCP